MKRREPQFMSPSSFSYVLQEVKPLTDYIYLHVLGEPLLHPQCEEILNICDANHMKVQLVTNGTFLKQYRLFKHPSVRKLSISLHSLDENPSIDLEDLYQTVLIYMDELQQDQYLELRFWRANTPSAKAEQFLAKLQNQFAFTDTKRNKSYQIKEHVYVAFADGFTWPDQNKDKVYTKGTCLGGIEQLAILVDGTVVPCCLDADGAIPFGNLFTSSLATILETKEYLDFVLALKENRLSAPLCQTCSYQTRFSK